MAERLPAGDEALEAPTDDFVGWIRVTLGGLASGVLPLWILLTVTLAQVHPDLRGELVYVEGEFVEVELPMAVRLAAGGFFAALAMVGLGALLAPVAAVVGLVRQRRAAVPTLPVDLDPALVAGATWEAQAAEPSEPEDAPPGPVVSAPEATPAEAAPPADDPEDPPDADPETGEDEDLDALFR